MPLEETGAAGGRVVGEDVRLTEAERETLFRCPECDLCGKTTCPDADLPEFSEPRDCAYAPIYHEQRYDRCEYGCGRDVTKASIRRDVVPTVDVLIAAAVASQRAELDEALAQVAAVRALHAGTHWCFGGDDPADLRDGIVFEHGTEWWPCPTLAALDAPAAAQPERDGGGR